MLSQFLVHLWFHLKLTEVFCYLMEEGGRNWLISVAMVEQLTDRGGVERWYGSKGSDCVGRRRYKIHFDWKLTVFDKE